MELDELAGRLDSIENKLAEVVENQRHIRRDQYDSRAELLDRARWSFAVGQIRVAELERKIEDLIDVLGVTADG